MKGKCNHTVKIGSTEPMWVADIQDPCILGTDFLEPHGCVVNLKDSILSIGDEEVPLRRVKSQASNLWSGISVKNKIRYAMQNVLQVDLQFVLQ